MSDITRSMTTRQRSIKTGLPPGTLMHVGERKEEATRITVLDYDEAQCNVVEVKSIEECFPYKDKPTVTWINIDGIHQVDVVEKLGLHYAVHPLVLEDIVNTHQRPKLDDYEDYLYIVFRMLEFAPDGGEIVSEQMSLILGRNFVLTFQEAAGDIFDPIRQRIRENKGRVRKMGADYLAYALIDMVVDHYFVILERLGEEIDDLEEELISNPSQQTLKRIYRIKSQLLSIRRCVWPLREVISSMERLDSPLIQDSTLHYLRDVYDHTVQVFETLETYRDMAASMIEIYLSSLSMKLNEVMKVLAIISTIFIPLTFVTSIYGMNFDHMPELRWPHGYFLVLGVMSVAALGMVYFFRRKQWL